ncbi:MAG: hypothetical protein II336_19665 [Loktanella sp.]|nr:hypothetical protein [Loktanella sp.]
MVSPDLPTASAPPVLSPQPGIAALPAGRLSVIVWPKACLIVTDGLNPGDALIVDAAHITDGQTVRVAQP